MKGRFLVVTSSDDSTVYLPLSRFLRIETKPPGHTARVTIVFEGYKVHLQATTETTTRVAQNVYEWLVPHQDRDVVHLRPNEQGANSISFEPVD